MEMFAFAYLEIGQIVHILGAKVNFEEIANLVKITVWSTRIEIDSCTLFRW